MRVADSDVHMESVSNDVVADVCNLIKAQLYKTVKSEIHIESNSKDLWQVYSSYCSIFFFFDTERQKLQWENETTSC